MADLDSLSKERLVEILRQLGVDARHLDELSPFGALPSGAALEPLPDGARDYLRSDRPRLRELREAYRGHPAERHVVWTEERVRGGLDLPWFRADNMFLWQTRSLATEMRYLLTACYVERNDSLGLRRVLSEDGLFGAHTLMVDGWRVSRDVLDSILQIDFLARTLGIHQIPSLTCLDVGAGYGRFGHRCVQALPNLAQMICTDAVPEASFVCDYYLRFRATGDKATSVPLHEIEGALAGRTIHVATNMHSFSECTLPSIEWWLDLIRRHAVRYLMIEPNARDAAGELTCLAGPEGPAVSFLPVVEARGYRRIALEPKYHASAMVQKHGLYATHYQLFELA